MNKKYFFFDVDGTLTDIKTGEIVSSAKEALKKLEANGHSVCIATGRAHYKAKKLLDTFNMKNMVCNGGNGLVINSKLVENIPLDYDSCLKIIKEAEDKNIGWLIAIDDSQKVYSRTDLFIKQVGIRKEPTTYIFNQHLNLNDIDNIYKIYLALDQDDEVSFKNLNLLGKLRFEKEYLMFQPDNKKQGIINMVKYLNGNIEDVVVFGDDYNDLVMFDKQWTSVAMGNACDDLKAKADYVAKDNIDDGIYIMCKQQGWF